MCQMFIHSSVNGHLGYFHYAKPSIYKQSCLTLTGIVHGSTIMGLCIFFWAGWGEVFSYIYFMYLSKYIHWTIINGIIALNNIHIFMMFDSYFKFDFEVGFTKEYTFFFKVLKT